MSDVVIRVEHLAKRYRIGARQEPMYRTLRDSLADVLSVPFRRRTPAGSDPTELWALDDVSFEVRRGRSSVSSAATARANPRC